MMSGICKKCKAPFELHHAKTWQCPKDGKESTGDHQEWEVIIYEEEEENPVVIPNIDPEILVRSILLGIGDDPSREGLIDTPKRVAKMWHEIFRGYDLRNRPEISVFKNGKDGLYYDQMIVDTGSFYSHCEHHMVPFFGRYWFGYIPDIKGNIIGLSKVARLVDFHAARLQIQERLGHDIVEDIWKELSGSGERPIGMGLVIKAEHLCKTMRGVKKSGEMTTIKLKGAFLDNITVKSEFLNFVK